MPEGKRINLERLKNNFIQLVKIDSPSRHEEDIAQFIRKWFVKEFPEATIVEDSSSLSTGSNVGNLIIKIPGNIEKEPIFFNAHMDTVEPGRGVKPIFQDGIFKSDGTTILGADDKAAIAIIFELLSVLKEQNLKYGPIELIFTTCEEIGLLGAKHLDISLIEAKAGIALDSEDPDQVINQAPSAIRFNINVHGLSAHAGLNPEKGINAIKVASSAIAKAPQGRIDEDTTCNIGVIKGGVATNIIPDRVSINGEVRSHNEKMLRKIQDEIIGCFYKAAEDFKATEDSNYPYVTVTVEDDYPLMKVPEDHKLVKAILQAGKNLKRDLQLVKTGGGSDANILNKLGLTTIILGIGMDKVHTTSEQISLIDMEKSVKLLLEIINIWS